MFECLGGNVRSRTTQIRGKLQTSFNVHANPEPSRSRDVPGPEGVETRRVAPNAEMLATVKG